MRIGVFGGTFDPVHYGHLILAEQAREQAKLDEVWFIPAAQPPHKADRPVSPFRHRAEMLQLAIAGHPHFRVDELESQRAGLSYTVETLDQLAQQHTQHQWELLIGSDTLAELATWRDPVGVLRRAGLVVMARAGAPILDSSTLRTRLRLPEDVSLRVQVIAVPLMEISSSDLRRRASAGRSLRYFLPRAVECYLDEKQLYATRVHPSPTTDAFAPG